MKHLKLIIFIAMLATILNLFGCTGTKQKEGEETTKVTQEQIEKSISDFDNRPIHVKLTEQIIDTTSDDDLLQVVFDNLSEKLPSDYEKEYETVLGWNKSQQAIYMIWYLEAEVNNGGYNQFYYNPGGQYYKHLPTALKLVGAKKFADLTNQANMIYEKEQDKITEHLDGTLEGFSKSYDDNPLNEFDSKFYALYDVENLNQMRIDYIRKHKTDFID